ncbi:MAG: hypothetical protein IPI76_13275 [Chloracidobacterium sp.]|nr:hypothetical protein [Chloracidobacterium sp.]
MKSSKSADTVGPGGETIDIQAPDDEDLRKCGINSRNPDGSTTTMRIRNPEQPVMEVRQVRSTMFR